MSETDTSNHIAYLQAQVWTTPDGEVAGTEALRLLVWLKGRAGHCASSGRTATFLDLPSASDRRCRRVVERLKDRGLLLYDKDQRDWYLSAEGIDVALQWALQSADAGGVEQAASTMGAVAEQTHVLRWTFAETKIDIDPRVLASNLRRPPPRAFRHCPRCGRIFFSRTRWCRKGHAAAHTRRGSL